MNRLLAALAMIPVLSTIAGAAELKALQAALPEETGEIEARSA